jgi:hypothetical protein
MRVKVCCLMVSFLLLFVTSSLAASYYVTVAANAGGVVTVSKEGVSIGSKAGKYLLVEGSPVTVAYTSNSGYYLPKVVADTVTAHPADYNTYTQTFTYDGKNHKIAATFAKDPTIVVSSNAGGVVSQSGPVVLVEYGADQSFTIASDTANGYHIAKVLVDGKTPIDFPTVTTTTPTSYSYTFSGVVAKHTLKAQFAINTYDVTTQVSDGGKIAPASFKGVKYGQTKTFTVTPSKGMKIESLTVNGNAETVLPASGAYKLTTTITADTVIAAVFSEYFPTGAARLKGTYNLVETEHGFWGASGYVNTNFRGHKIIAVFDGKGGCSLTANGYSFYPSTDQNNNQVVNSSVETRTHSGCTYTVNGDGSFTIKRSTGDVMVTGWVSKDGNSVVIGGAYKDTNGDGTGYNIQQAAGVKAGASMTKSAIQGTYHLINQDAGFWQSTNSSPTSVGEYLSEGLIDVTFDGAGGCTLNEPYRTFSRGMFGTGGVNDEIETHTPGCSYTAASNGFFTLTIAKESTKTDKITVWIGADANVLVIGGGSKNSETGGIDYNVAKNIGVKAGANMTNASVSGTYQIVSANLTFKDFTSTGSGTDAFRGNNVTATFDGAGVCSFSNNSSTSYSGINGNGTVTEETYPTTPTTTCSYSVDTKGVITIDTTRDGETDHGTGWVSADGMAMLVGGPDKTDGGDVTRYSTTLVYGVKTQ